MPSTIFTSQTLRIAVAPCNLMTCISSIIVVGITGYSLKAYPHDRHLMFEICISAVVLTPYLPSFSLPLLTKSYRSYYLSLNLIFSYLFLTALVFAAQDYNESSCEVNAPFEGSCNLKLTSEAFLFLAFFFTLVSTGVDAYAYLKEAIGKAEPVHPKKPMENAGVAA